MKILLVEDELKALEGIARLIADFPEPYVVAGKARNAQTGIKMALELQPDVIITDIRMNGMSGLEMIRTLGEKGLRCRYIVLSGYADFHYAQEGISLGIEDYLLKPVLPGTLENALKKVEKSIEAESGQIHISRLRPEELLEGALFADFSVKNRYQDEWNRQFPEDGFLLLIHGENRVVQSDWSAISAALAHSLPELSGFGCRHSRSKDHYFFFPHFRDSDLAKLDEVLKRCRKTLNPYLVFAGTLINAQKSLPEWSDLLRDLSVWNLSSDRCRVLTQERIPAKTPRFLYPEETERKLIGYIENGTAQQMTDTLGEFLSCLSSEVYDCGDVREALISMTAAILYAIRRKSYGLYENINSMHVLDWVKETLFPESYLQMMTNILIRFEQSRSSQSYSANPIVNRVLKIMNQEYKEDLPLDEMAQRMNVTPEYLSGLFMRELGIKYTTCRSQIRIDAARRLLEEGKLKIYEVAEESGFPDVKYFSKVFKKYTGVSPGEYVRTSRS